MNYFRVETNLTCLLGGRGGGFGRGGGKGGFNKFQNDEPPEEVREHRLYYKYNLYVSVNSHFSLPNC